MRAEKPRIEPGRIGAEPPISEELAAFVSGSGVRLHVVDVQDAALAVRVSEDRRECDLNVLYQGGWIMCGTARALADKLGIANGEMGRLMDQLDIKVRGCALGCF